MDRLALNLENRDLEGDTLLTMEEDEPTVIVSLKQKGIIVYR